jgi:DNA-binding HxlR family transcriptional regulator
MKTRPTEYPDWRSGCPINISLEIFGDRWSLLIVRDLMFSSRRTFTEFAEAGEGVASNVLADRLQRLEQHGIIDRRPDPADGRRVRYGLTEKGLDLAAVLLEMIGWAGRHEDTAAPAAMLDRLSSDREGFLTDVRRRWAAERRAKG